MAKNDERGIALRERLRRWSLVLWAMVVSRMVRLTILVLMIGLTGWLLYARAWRPLQQEVSLPPEVGVGKPAVDRETLERVNQQRTQRTKTPLQIFANQAALFPVASPTSTPPPR